MLNNDLKSKDELVAILTQSDKALKYRVLTFLRSKASEDDKAAALQEYFANPHYEAIDKYLAAGGVEDYVIISRKDLEGIRNGKA